jgi:hypothetical protein
MTRDGSCGKSVKQGNEGNRTVNEQDVAALTEICVRLVKEKRGTQAERENDDRDEKYVSDEGDIAMQIKTVSNRGGIATQTETY